MSKDYSRFYRLFDLFVAIRSTRGLNVEKLSKMFDLTERTIYRDIDVMKQSNIPIEFNHVHGGYEIDGDFFMQPIELTYEEGLAVCGMLGQLAETEQIPFLEPAFKAVLKIKSQLSPGLREELDQASEHIEMKLAKRSEGDEVRDVYERMRDAIVQKHALVCVYDSPGGNGDDESFLFKPYKLYFGKRAWYVYGWHGGHDAVRCLKLQRFSAVKITEQNYEIPDGFSLEDHIGQAWRMIRGDKRYQVEIVFDTGFADTIEDTVWHQTQETELLEDGRLRFTCEVDGLDEIVWWVMSMGPHCEVKQPAELADRVKQMAEEVVARYEPSRI
ncbi:helix-turn-helix transcriptional regulator [Poriferisphaera sp. WC338]|uniref:helix-turn-helix transcriptional regulator n=1 Tax=Poriferisphaera sp. WC338 TaxID=3425129 RepID=UPI003D81AACD